MRWRTPASGAHSDKRSSSFASSGLFVSVGMRPVAAPHHALRRGLDVSLGDRRGLGVARRAVEHVGAGKLHPGVALVEHSADHAERWIGDARRREPPEMIEHDGAGQALQQVGGADDLIAPQMNLHVQAERLGALRQRLDHVERGGGGLRVELCKPDTPHALGLHRLQLGVGDGRVHHRDAACLRRPVGRGRRALLHCRYGWRRAAPPPRGWCRSAAGTAGIPGRGRRAASAPRAAAAGNARRRRCACGSRRRWPALSGPAARFLRNWGLAWVLRYP